MLAAAARRVSVRTGVSDAEAFGSLPGDDIIPHPMVEWTRGVTVRTSAERVWPWLAQMGYGRGGWYTPEWVDLLANRWVFGIRAPVPEERRPAGLGVPTRRGRGPHLRRPGLRVVLPCRARRSTACARLPLDPPPTARKPDRHRRPGVAREGRAAAPRGRHLRRLHLGADAEPASRRPDAAARTDARELCAAHFRTPGAAARDRRRDLRRRHAACDREACRDDRSA